MVRDNNPMAASLKIVPTLVLPTALALMPLWAGMAQTPAAGGSQLLERVYKAQDYYALSELAREQITLNPKNVYAHYYMAIALQQLGQMREADKEYRKVVDLDKNGPYAMRAIQSLRTLATSATRAHQTAPAVTAATSTTNSDNKAKDANTTTANQSGLSNQRECLINAAEREKTSATARFNGEVNSINKQESLNAADKDARIQEALKRMMRTQSEVDAKLSSQLTELNGKGDTSGRNRTPAQTVVTSGAGGLVRNYEHLDSDAESVVLPSENPLSATALKMPVSTGKKSGAKAK